MKAKPIQYVLGTFLLLVSACTQSSPILLGGSVPTNTTTTSTCTSSLVAQLTPSGTSAFTVGQSVLWTVAAQGCSGMYQLIRPGYANASFTAQTSYSATYSTAATSQTESVTVLSVDSNGNTLSTLKLNSLSFTVKALVPPTPACPAITPWPATQTANYASGSTSTTEPVTFGFSVTLAPATTLASISTPNPNSVTAGPSLPYTSVSTASFSISLNAAYSNTVYFNVANASGAGLTAQCPSTVQISPTTPTPPPTPTPPTPPPATTMSMSVVTGDGKFTATQANAPYNSTAFLTWATANVNSGTCTLNTIGVAANGSFTTPALTVATTYNLTCYGLDLSPHSISVTVNVDAPPQPKPHTSSLSVNGVYAATMDARTTDLKDLKGNGMPATQIFVGHDFKQGTQVMYMTSATGVAIGRVDGGGNPSSIVNCDGSTTGTYNGFFIYFRDANTHLIGDFSKYYQDRNYYIAQYGTVKGVPVPAGAVTAWLGFFDNVQNGDPTSYDDNEGPPPPLSSFRQPSHGSSGGCTFNLGVVATY